MSSQKNIQPVGLLAMGLCIVLFYAGVELAAGWLLGVSALVADGLHMLTHSGHLAFALLVQAIAQTMGFHNRKNLESFGSFAIAIFMLVMAGSLIGGVYFGDNHAHHPEHGGIALMVAGLAGFFVHLYVGKKLYGGRCHPLVYGACMFTFAHVLLSLLIFTGGLLDAVHGWPHTDVALTTIVAMFMVYSAGRIALFAYNNLPKKA